ncbi:serine/threonine-protein kinase [Kitasatospora sp. NPDC049285]|uniref:serine/threonine-protein kinase n=1 Tax=Kitasatospora sp. NPDC049285 TaxID=3157096 RepID=UPI00343E9993
MGWAVDALGPGDPRRVGEYRLLRRLGAGGMGEVYLGRSPGGRTVAVKLVRGEYAADQEFRDRFRQEVAAARRVGGQWTAPVLDADTEGEHPWVATGYVAGPPLSEAVREFGPLPLAVVRALGAGLGETLAHVHGTGLVHRDIKPSNILLALDGPRLIDFGIARALDAATALTRSGYVVGSPGFMSPEQANGRQAGPPGDVFSLGAVLAFAATGIAPFGEGVSAAVLLYRVLHEAPDLGGLDGALRAVILDCLAKEPEDRPDPTELRRRLTAAGPGTVRLGQRGWLPTAVSESVGRLAVELLALDVEPADAVPAHPPTVTDGTAPAEQPPGEQPPGEQPVVLGTPTAPHGPSGRRTLPIVLASAVAVAATAGGITLWLTHDTAAPAGNGGPTAAAPPASPSPSPSPTPSPSPSPSPSPTSLVPAAFLGVWQGDVHQVDKDTQGKYRIQFSPGNPGANVGRASTTWETTGVPCGAVDELASVSGNTVTVLETTTSISASCAGDVALKIVFTLTDDGHLIARQDGFDDVHMSRQQ